MMEVIKRRQVLVGRGGLTRTSISPHFGLSSSETVERKPIFLSVKRMKPVSEQLKADVAA